MKRFTLLLISLVTLTACSNDPASMWNSRYAFKSIGQVMQMCDNGDKAACYAARDMQNLNTGLSGMSNQIQQEQQREEAAINSAPRIVTTNCNSVGNMVSCTSM